MLQPWQLRSWRQGMASQQGQVPQSQGNGTFSPHLLPCLLPGILLFPTSLRPAPRVYSSNFSFWKLEADFRGSEKEGK